MTSYTTVFGGETIRPADISYRAFSISTSTQLYWPIETNANAQVIASQMDISATTTSLAVLLDDATKVGVGTTVVVKNAGSNTFTVLDSASNTIVSITAGQVYYIYLQDNSTAAGTWSSFALGAGTSSASAAALAGAGLIAVGSLLAQAVQVDTFSSTGYTIGTADRGKAKVWIGGAGTLNLPSPGTVGSDFFVHVKNGGSGTLTVTPASGTIDDASSIAMAVNDSFIIVSDGSTEYWTIGKGVAPTVTTTYLSIAVGGTGDYTLSAGEQNKSIYRFTGVLTGNRNIIVPSTVAQYTVRNETSGAFTLTVKTAAGSGVAVTQSSSGVMYCDGTNIVQSTPSGITTPVSIANGGTSATTASSARTALGSTATGDALFTAASAAAGRSTLGSGATGDTLFTAATAASARSTLGSGAVGDAIFVAAAASAVWTQIGTGRSISTSGYTTGGGDLSANRTISLGSMGAVSRILGSGSAAATITDLTVGTGLSISGTTLSCTVTGGNTNSDPVITVYTTGSGTHNVNANTKWMRVRVVGGGGAGGGAPATGAGQSSSGAGGSSGGYIEHWYASPSASYSYAVGGGGTGASGTTGGNGGDSTFGALTAPGGFGGGVQGPATNTVAIAPGASTPTGGNILNVAGQCGGATFYSQTASVYITGNGGDGPWGGGGLGPAQSTAGNSGIANTGGGGSGTCNASSQAVKTGPNGGSGVIIVEEYIWT